MRKRKSVAIIVVTVKFASQYLLQSVGVWGGSARDQSSGHHPASSSKIAQERVAPCRGRGRGRRKAAAWPASPGAGWPSPHWPGARSVTSLSGFAPLGRPSPPSSLLAISSKYLKLSSDRTYSVGPCRPCSCGPPFPSRVVEGKTRGRPGARGKDRHGDSRRTGVTGVPMRAA